MTIGERLKRIRLFLGLTQTEMAADVVTESFYSKVERGISKIKMKDLLAILNKNGVTLEDFFELREVGIDQKFVNELKSEIIKGSKVQVEELMALIFKDGKDDELEQKAEVASLAVTYLKRCYQEGWLQEGKNTIAFIEQLPPYPNLAIEKLLAQYYQALFNKDKKKLITIKKILAFNGYSHLQESLPQLNEEEDK